MMSHSKPRAGGYQSRTVASLRRLAYWAGAWAVTTMLMKLGPRLSGSTDLGLMLLSAALDVAVGVGLILAHKNWLAETDELQRKVYLDALGITLGVTMIAGVAYEYLDKYGVIPFHFSNLLILTSVTLVASTLYGTWRYR